MRAKLLKLENLAEQRHNLATKFIDIDNDNKTITIFNKNGDIIRYYTSDGAPTVRRFHDDDTNFHRLIMGPRGSSKSTGCCAEPFFRLAASSPCRDGIKRARGLIGRETYGELRTTTIQTFAHWFGLPELNWRIRWQPPISCNLEFFDGEYLCQLEIFFISFDNAAAAKKALSLEITWAYFNEVSEIASAVLDETTGSVGRYPAKSDKIENGNYWNGMFYDSNAFATYHPLHTKFVQERPEGHLIYIQPGGLIEKDNGSFFHNPKAENIDNLPERYYENMAMGKTKEFIRTRICNEFGNFEQGKKCHPEYDEKLHAVDKIELNPDYPIRLFFDYGGTNCCLILQYIDGQLLAIKEIISATQGLREFLSARVKRWLEEYANGYRVERCIGDPADNFSHENALYSHEIVRDILQIDTYSAYTNAIKARLDAVDQLLLKRMIGIGCGIKISKQGCPVLHAGLAGKYKLKLVKTVDGVAPVEKPDKNTEYSHPNDCLQYAALDVIHSTKDKILTTGIKVKRVNF